MGHLGPKISWFWDWIHNLWVWRSGLFPPKWMEWIWRYFIGMFLASTQLWNNQFWPTLTCLNERALSYLQAREPRMHVNSIQQLGKPNITNYRMPQHSFCNVQPPATLLLLGLRHCFNHICHHYYNLWWKWLLMLNPSIMYQSRNVCCSMLSHEMLNHLSFINY